MAFRRMTNWICKRCVRLAGKGIGIHLFTLPNYALSYYWDYCVIWIVVDSQMRYFWVASAIFFSVCVTVATIDFKSATVSDLVLFLSCSMITAQPSSVDRTTTVEDYDRILSGDYTDSGSAVSSPVSLATVDA
jgi:hypothetical protein